jgi:hypothetical protein
VLRQVAVVLNYQPIVLRRLYKIKASAVMTPMRRAFKSTENEATE